MKEASTRVDIETADLTAGKRDAFNQLFPGVMADGVIDIDRLSEMLAADATGPIDAKERYGLQWAGKQQALKSLLTPSRATLIPTDSEAAEFDSARNVFIEGDNLEVLKLLQKSYNDRVSFIYIDPPYNTGNDFVYDDDFSDGLRGYLEYTGELDEDGKRTSARAEVAGRRHSRWLSMIYPRLVLARNLLTPKGIFAVSIDDNEAANLRSVLDEVFGAENYLNTFVWVSNLKGRQISGSGAAATKEYIYFYARNATEVGPFKSSASALKDMMPAIYKGFDYEIKHDEVGPYVTKNELYNSNSAFNEETRENLVYNIYYNPETGDVKTSALSDRPSYKGYVKISPKKNNDGVHKYHAFRWSRGLVESNKIDLAFVESGTTYRVYTKVRDIDSTAVKDIVLGISTNEGSADLSAIGLDPDWFSYPKPVRLIKLLVAFASDPEGVILDFFAGSGTTAHAVALQNVADGGKRTVISVNLPEPTPPGSAARKAGLEHVSDITYRRLVAVANNISGADAQGLRAFRLGESNFLDESPNPEELSLAAHTLPDGPRDWDAIASEVLIKEGVRLDEPWERSQCGNTQVIIAGGVAIALSDNVTDELVNSVLGKNPRVAVFLEDGFADADTTKANAFTSAKSRGITMKTV